MEKEPKNIYNLIILDESGSMSDIREQAVSAMNETCQSVRIAQDRHPDCNYYVSLVVFEGSGVTGVRTVRDRVPVGNILDIGQDEYRPGGCTPLYDAMGLSISALAGKTRPDDPVLVTIITDGMENSSEEYSGAAIKKLVSRMRERGWTFAYIGANQDAIEVARDLSIRNALNFDADRIGIKKMSRRLKSMNDICFSKMALEKKCTDMEGLFEQLDDIK